MYRALHASVLLILNGKKTVKFIALRRLQCAVKQSKVKYLLVISHSLSSQCGQIKDLLKT